MNEPTRAAKTARDAIKTDLGNIIEAAWKAKAGLCEIWDRLFGPPPPEVNKDKASPIESPPGLIQAVEVGLGEIRRAHNEAYEILADILGRL
jgi:hypothetical protein